MSALHYIALMGSIMIFKAINILQPHCCKIHWKSKLTIFDRKFMNFRTQIEEKETAKNELLLSVSVKLTK